MTVTPAWAPEPAEREMTPEQRTVFMDLRNKLAPGGEYYELAERRVERREERNDTIMRLIDGRA